MKLEEASTILDAQESRISLGLPSVTEHIWFYNSECVNLDGAFTIDELKKLISFMESIED
jgi:hypothetical protein